MIYLKIVFLFMGVWFTLINVFKLVHNNPISRENVLVQAIGIVGFLVLQFNLL